MNHPIACRVRLAAAATALLVWAPAAGAFGPDAGRAEIGGLPERTIGLEARIACERSIQEVYERHRIWPDSNPGLRPPLSERLSRSVLDRRVRDALSKSAALAALWKRPITAAQLRTEMAHMARNTRDPRTLGELWEALGNDATLVAECLARPALADRLLRAWYGFDERIHAELRESARSDLRLHGTAGGMRAMSGLYDEQVWRLGGPPETGLDGLVPEGTGVRTLDRRSWESEAARLHALFGRDRGRFAAGGLALPVGTLSSLQEDEGRFYVLAILESSPASLTVATVTWPKRPFDDWWEASAPSFPANAPAAAVQVEPLPAIAPPGCPDDTWGATPFAPHSRDLHVMVWTGAELLVWGGDFVEGENVPGGRYDPVTDTWRPIASIGQPTMRGRATGVWTGTNLIVWGGWGGGTADNVENTGGRYDPLTDSWRPTSVSGAVPAARWYHTAVWTGEAMIVWGGCTSLGCSTTLDTGARYDPSTDAWSPVATSGAPPPRSLHTAVWTGSRMIVWGGERPGTIHQDGGLYDPASDAWSAMTRAGAPEARSLHSAVWTGSEMVVWGGCRSSACYFPPLASGGRYDPAADAWRSTSTTGAPYQRHHHSAVWSGTEMIVWGGCVDAECSDFRDSGGRYDPRADAWTPTSATNVPLARAMHTALWTGSEMIVWGGCLGGQCEVERPDGGRYSPSSDSWVPIGAGGSPIGRAYHTAVWTGAEMIVWGGTASSPMREGKRYDPATDRWSPVTSTGAPDARAWHSAVWTGTEMIVWGGALRFGGPTATGGRYDPAADAWRPTSAAGAPLPRNSHTAVWTGEEMIVWGGMGDAVLSSGGRYDPAADAWAPTSTAGAPSARFAHGSVWTGAEMIVWGGGADFTGSTATGARYAPATDTWSATSLSGAPGARRLHTAVWTGTEMIVWGGERAAGLLGDGGRYDPESDSWAAVSLASAPSPRRDHTAVWTGSRMIVWGGEDVAGPQRTGGRYDPAQDDWAPTGAGAFAPTGRTLHTAVWTGTEAVVWGGRGEVGYTDTGGRYCASGSAGSWPGAVDGLVVTYTGGGLLLSWNPSCGGATDYAVYQGTAGDWDGYVPYLCSTGGAMSVAIPANAGDQYFLIVPHDGSSEGSYGTAADGTERPPAAGACLPAQSLGVCP